MLQAVRAFAEKHDLGYTIHLTQSVAEVDFMVRHHGLRPTAFLARHGFLGPRLFAAHCRYVDEAISRYLAVRRRSCRTRPAMAANRGVIPPIPALRAAGCPIANGTDNNTNDLFEVMRVALLTERIRRNDPFPGVQPQPEDMLADATQGGARARASGNGARLARGREEGRSARRGYATGSPRSGRTHHSAWIHNGQGSDIESVMIDGEFVMRNRKILTEDEEGIVAEADKVGRRIWRQVLAAGPLQVPRLPRRQ